MYKILGLLWLDKTDPAAKKLLRGIQFGGNFVAGAEALARLFQIEIETSPHGEILKLDLRNFFNELCRGMIVDGAELADPLFALYVAGLYGEETTYVYDPANTDARHFFDTRWGTVQGDVLSARLAALAILPAQRKLFSILRKKYPQALFSAGPPPENEEKIAEACTSRLSAQDKEELHELISSLPNMEEILQGERRDSGSNSHGLQPEHVHISLRAFVDDQTVKVPRLLSEKVERLLSPFFFVLRRQSSHQRRPLGGTSMMTLPGV